MNGGIHVTKDSFHGVIITRTTIMPNQETCLSGEDYCDISFCNVKPEDSRYISAALAAELGHIAKLSPGDTVLALGLGNPDFAADSLGPATVEKLNATRALSKLFPENSADITKVCAVNLDVIGKTGIGVQEMVEMLVNKLNPDLIVVIDAMDVHGLSHIGRTIRISNAGLRQERRVPLNLTAEALGVPVVAIGIPFVTDAATIANDVLQVLLASLCSGSDDERLLFYLTDYDKRMSLIKSVISRSHLKNTVFAPENIGAAVKLCSEIIAQGINAWAGAKTASLDNYCLA